MDRIPAQNLLVPPFHSLTTPFQHIVGHSFHSLTTLYLALILYFNAGWPHSTPLSSSINIHHQPLFLSTTQQQQRSSFYSRMAAFSTLLALFLAIISSTMANDPDMLQDICVADLSSGVKVNGFPCKKAANVTADDFFFAGLAKPGATNNSMGSLVTTANVEKIAGLNTLGTSLARIDYAPGGLNPPHTHPRATELVFVLYGELDVGFITTANVLISKTVKEGQIFTFPRGLVHFQKNNGEKPAAVISAFNSQLPGTQSIAATLFSATPPVPDNVLTKAFQVGTKEVDKIKSKFAPKK